MYNLDIYVNISFFILTSSLISYFIFNGLLNKKFLSKKVNRQNNERWGDSNKSHLGGIAFSVCAILTSVIIISQNTFTIGEITNDYKSFIGIFFVILIASLVGVIDEKENMMPLTKLFFQFIISSVLIWAGFVIPLTNFFFLNIVFSVFWIILLINAINMFDNVDGATGIFSLIIFILFLILGIYLNVDLNLIFILSAYIGSLTLFLFFNYYPSKLFMGDIGSLQIASVIGALSIKLVWQENTSDVLADKIYYFLINNAIFYVIFLDVIIVSIYRISKGKSPFIGDTNHLSHALIKVYNNPRLAVITLSAITLLLSIQYLFFEFFLKEVIILTKLLFLSLSLISVSFFLGFLYYRGIIKEDN